jgi:hypothetical protein
MKKSTIANVRWQQIHIKSIRKRERTHDARLARWKQSIARTVEKPIIYNIPRFFDLTSNYDESINLINSLVRTVFVDNKRAYLDFRSCENISYDACVVLAATIDRCRKLRPSSVDGRHPENAIVYSLLRELGFYSMLGIAVDQQTNLAPTSNIRIAPMESRATDFKGSPKEILKGMKTLFDNIETEVTRRTTKQLYRCLSEAMLNVLEHAYPNEMTQDPTVLSRWWSAGFSDQKTGKITIIFYDQGAGIPNTLEAEKPPKQSGYSNDWKGKIKELTKLLGRKPTDGEKIVLAMELGVTSKENPEGMGKGLPDTKRLFDNADGVLRILSYKGDYTLVVNDNKESPHVVGDRNIPLQGTMISWVLKNVR